MTTADSRTGSSAAVAGARWQPAQLALLAALACATLWDYRLFDVRIFDAAAVVLLGAYLLCRPEPLEGFLRRRRRAVLLFATIAIYALFGFLVHEHRSSLAILALSALGFILIGREDWLAFGWVFRWLLAIHIAAFAIQFVVFYATGLTVDYQMLFGVHARIDASESHLRAAGLFQEPNSYCVNTFVLGTLAIFLRRSGPLIAAALVTLILSESLWGFGAAAVMAVLYAINAGRLSKRRLVRIALLALVLFAAFNGYLWLTKAPNMPVPHIYSRIANILGDTSLRDRYLQADCDAQAAPGAETGPVLRSAKWIFGTGLSTKPFTVCLPANGIAFLAVSFGALGVLLVGLGFARAARGMAPKAAFSAALALLFSFTTYPLVTYLIFWIWLGATLGLLRLPPNGKPARIA